MDTEKNTADKQDSARKPASKTISGVILRILLVVITGSVIGGAIYFSAVGWIPYFEQRVFEPLDSHQQEIQELRAAQIMLETQVGEMAASLNEIQSEGSQQLQSTLAAIAESAAEQDANLGSLQATADQNTYYSATLLPALLSTASARQESTDRNLSALATAQMEKSLDSREAALLKVLAFLSRANQFLLHDNYGLAEEVLTAASEYLQEIGSGPTGSDQQIVELLQLVNGARADLPDRPEIAASKLELAWQLAMTGLELETSSTPRPSGSPGPTLTPTPTPN